jgi:hypothetical protein
MEALSDTSTTILEPENEAPSMVTKSLWDVAIPFYSACMIYLITRREKWK